MSLWYFDRLVNIKVLIRYLSTCVLVALWGSLTASSVSGTLQFVLPVWAPCCFLLTRGNVSIGLVQIAMSWLAIWWGSLYMSKHDRDYVTQFSSFIWLQVTKGLLQKFGPDRVLDTPITEVSGIEHMQAEHSSLLLLGLKDSCYICKCCLCCLHFTQIASFPKPHHLKSLFQHDL